MHEHKEPTMRVNVTKAELPLAEGESIDSVLSMLRDDAHAQLKKSLKVEKLKDPDWVHAWAEDVFADAIVLRLSGYGPNFKKDMQGLYQMTWKRDGNSFTFGQPVRVMRKISYVPLKDAPVRKAEGLWVDVL